MPPRQNPVVWAWRPILVALLLGIAVAAGAWGLRPRGAPPARAAAVASSPYVPGVILVKRRSSSALGDLLREPGVQSVQGTLGYVGVEKLVVARGQELTIAQRLVQKGLADYAQPDYLRHTADVTPNDPYYQYQWDMSKIDAPAAWGLTLGSPSVTVAVIDTGYYLAHPDRPVNLVQGPTYTAGSAPYDGCPPEGINGPDDDDGHGTHVGGTIAAAFNNGVGVAGLAPGVRLLVIKAGDCNGSFADSDIVQAIGYAVGNGAKVINMSFGGAGYDDVLNTAVQNAWSSGVVLVAAAGNYATNAFVSPADLANVVAVSATDQNDQLASYSNYGPYITVAAPGGDLGSAQILSTTPPSGLDSCGQYYCYQAGTSMAAPHVAAIAGLVLSYVPSLTNAQVVQALKNGAVSLGGSVPNQFFGYGRVDAFGALGAAQAIALTPSPTPTPSSTPTPTPSPSATAPLGKPRYAVYLPSVFDGAQAGPSPVVPPTTATPTPTPTPSPTPTGAPWAFFDDFSNPGSGWPTAPVLDSNGAVVATRGYTNGTYQLLFQQGNYLALAGHNLFTADFQVAADVWPAASTDGTIGLYFDNSSTTGLYDFEVGLGGFYLARFSYATNAWTTIIPLTTSAAIMTGNQVNHIQVVRIGSLITLYANGREIGQVTDSTYPTGFVGLAASAKTAPFDARFDNFGLSFLSATPTSQIARSQAGEGESEGAIARGGFR